MVKIKNIKIINFCNFTKYQKYQILYWGSHFELVPIKPVGQDSIYTNYMLYLYNFLSATIFM